MRQQCDISQDFMKWYFAEPLEFVAPGSLAYLTKSTRKQVIKFLKDVWNSAVLNYNLRREGIYFSKKQTE